MKKRLDTLKDSIPIIRKLGAEVGIQITEEEIARKMKMSREQFEGYMNAVGKTPNEVLTQLWAAYDDLVRAVQRSNSSAPLRNIINLVKELGKAKGLQIMDKDIVGQLAIPREQFEAYLSGESETPDDVLSLFWSAWPDLLKNVRRIRTVEKISFTEEMLDEDVE